jgi:PEGA domain-containing protein
MSARVVLAVAVTLAAGSAWAGDKAQPREGGSADSSRSVGESHHSGSHQASSPSDHGSSSWSKTGSQPSFSSSSREQGRSRPPQTDAQRRHPRPGTGTGRFDNDGRRSGFRGGSSYYYYGGSRYGRYGYYYNPYDSWYSPYYYSGYYGYSPYYYGRSRGVYGRGYREGGSLRIIVDPEKTRVYVDGYYAGIADDFDGILQRLNVPPGRHDITLKLEGYRTQHFKVYVPLDDTIKIHYDMVRGSGEATSEQFAGVPADYARVEDMDDADGRRGEDDGRYDRGDADRDGRDAGDIGSVRLQVTPRDASVYVDGEFRGSGRQSTNLRLRPGRHRIEVVRPGFRTVEREVEVRSGRNEDIEFDLEKL